jgi:hypothetical protein
VSLPIRRPSSEDDVLASNSPVPRSRNAGREDKIVQASVGAWRCGNKGPVRVKVLSVVYLSRLQRISVFADHRRHHNLLRRWEHNGFRSGRPDLSLLLEFQPAAASHPIEADG